MPPAVALDAPELFAAVARLRKAARAAIARQASDA